jgi:hypothetical protein
MAMKSSSTIAVSGLRDFRNELRRLETESGSDGSALLKDANWKVAQFVTERAQTRAGTVGRQQARAAESLRASKTVNRAQVAGGSAKVPFFFGAEFGAKQNILRSERRAAGWAGPGRYLGFRQFAPWKRPGGGNTGYFLFPTLRAETQNIIDLYGDELDKVTAKAFPKGRL